MEYAKEAKVAGFAPFASFAALAIAWTWPLVRHLDDALPGYPGDNFSFVWNLWWMRRVLATPGLRYFHTTYLFYPFGTAIVDHPHTALPAFVAATVLRGLSVAAAQNVLLIAYVFANMACMYALARSILGPRSDPGSILDRSRIGSRIRSRIDVARRSAARRAAVVAAIVFGLSPYVAVHLLGHFDLVAAWPLPLYALALRRAVDRRSAASAVAAGVVLAATAYTVYYYVVYLCFFTAVYAIASTGALSVSRSPTPMPPSARRLRAASAAVAVLAAVVAAAIAATGGTTVSAGAQAISARTPQNALTVMWIALATCAIATWRPRIHVHPSPGIRWAAAAALRIAGVFVVLASPLLWQAARLILRGEYVTQKYGWRSIPQGVDLLAPLAGHPLHPLFGSAAARAYGVFGQDFVETIGWIGIVPLALLAAGAPKSSSAGDALRRDARIWRAVAVVFGVWALGPFLTIGGFDTGLKLPAILLRFVPIVENARMPGRAMVVVYMALGVLLAIRVAAERGRLGSALVQWSLVAAIAFEYWDAPLRLTTLDRPKVYEALAAAEPGAVCEAPMGIGDGLSVGVGSQDRRVLFYATQHEHPLVGGFIGRMPEDARERYERMPVVASLLAASDRATDPVSSDGGGRGAPCRYLVLHRASSSAGLLSYVEKLPARQLTSDDGVVLYRLE